MAWTQAHVTTLQAAVASGVLTVSYNGRSTTYQSLSEMRALLADMERQVSATTRTYRLAAVSKGV